jgi:hypothetical protein
MLIPFPVVATSPAMPRSIAKRISSIGAPSMPVAIRL